MPTHHSFIKVINAVFAFDTDLQSQNGLERYERIHAGSPRALHSICVAGSGLWDFSSDGWVPRPHGNFAEVLEFIAQVGNTFRRALDTRGAPPLGNYLR